MTQRSLRHLLPAAAPTPTTPDPVTLTANVENGAKNVKVSTVVAVTAANGTIDSVKVSYRGKDSKGKAIKGTVKGTLAKGKTGWTAGDRGCGPLRVGPASGPPACAGRQRPTAWRFRCWSPSVACTGECTTSPTAGT